MNSKTKLKSNTFFYVANTFNYPLLNLKKIDLKTNFDIKV